MSATDLHQKSVAELARALAAREVSAVETAQHFLARMKTHEALASFVAVDPEATLAQARAADAAIAGGNAPALAGVPIAHKDIFVTTDFATTAGSKMLAGYRSPFDATVVRQLAAAGTVTLGKLSCDEFAMGSANENVAVPAVGFDRAVPVRNPWNRDRIPGGSSGASAAAVAARLSSIRISVPSGAMASRSIRPPKPVSSCRPMIIHSSDRISGAATIMSSSSASLGSIASASGFGAAPTCQILWRMGTVRR